MNFPITTRRRLVEAQDALAQESLLLKLCNERVARRDKMIAELRLASKEWRRA